MLEAGFLTHPILLIHLFCDIRKTYFPILYHTNMRKVKSEATAVCYRKLLKKIQAYAQKDPPYLTYSTIEVSLLCRARK